MPSKELFMLIFAIQTLRSISVTIQPNFGSDWKDFSCCQLCTLVRYAESYFHGLFLFGRLCIRCYTCPASYLSSRKVAASAPRNAEPMSSCSFVDSIVFETDRKLNPHVSPVKTKTWQPLSFCDDIEIRDDIYIVTLLAH